MGLKTKLRKILKIDPRLMRKLRKILAPFRRIGLKKDFSLLANNCWGGRLYDKFSLQYLSPTIGLSFSPDDFLKFVSNLEYYLTLELKPIDEVQKKVNNEWGFYDCLLGDIKVLFRHYRSVDDAIQKWNRRKKRIKYDNIILKMTCYENYDKKLLEEYDKLPFKKILFLCDGINHTELRNTRIVQIPKDKIDSEFIISDSKLKLKEIKKIINN